MPSTDQDEAHEAEWLLTIPMAARLIGISVSGVYRLLREGEIHPVKVGSVRRIRREDLRRYVEGLPAEAEPVGA